MKTYIKNFFEDGKVGIETIEFIGLVVVAAVLIAVVANIGISFADQATSAENQMTSTFGTLEELAEKQPDSSGSSSSSSSKSDSEFNSKNYPGYNLENGTP